MANDNGSDHAAFMTSGGVEGRELAPGFEVRTYLSTDQDSPSLNSGSATVMPGGGLPYHRHPTGELIICVVGQADVYVEGRRYRLDPHDAIHVPAGVAHGLRNDTADPAIMHTVFPTGTPERDFVEDAWGVEDRTETDASVPESLVVFTRSAVVPLGDLADVLSLTDPLDTTRDVAARIVRMAPGAVLDLAAEDRDQSLFLAVGAAVCEVGEQRFDMTGFCDTVCIRRGQSRRLRNAGTEPAAVIIAEGR